MSMIIPMSPSSPTSYPNASKSMCAWPLPMGPSGPDSYPPPSLESSSSESSSVASGCALSLSLAIAALSSAGFYSAKEHIAAHDVGPDAGRDTPDRVRGRFILHCNPCVPARAMYVAASDADGATNPEAPPPCPRN